MSVRFVLTDSCPPKGALDVPGLAPTTGPELKILGPHPGKAPVAFGIGVPARMRVELAIFDIAGRRVRTLLNDELPAGHGEVRWDGRGGNGATPGAGVYFARLSADGRVRVTRLVLLR